MTKFEELTDIINRKRGSENQNLTTSNESGLEVAGSEGSKTPLLECGDDNMDMDIEKESIDLMMDRVGPAGTQLGIKKMKLQ